MIRIENLTVHYGTRQALDNITLSVDAGDFVLVTGPSGCGKSTLARCLNGLIPHSLAAKLTGHVIVAGLDTTEHSTADLARSVGLVFQNPSAQFFNLTVDEEIAFGPRNLGLSEIEVAERIGWALESTGLTGFEDRAIATLSGGELQRLAIAAVLAMRPRLLVLDEPTSSLDVTGSRQVMRALSRINESGITIVVIEHRLGVVAQNARRTIVMDGGRIVADGLTSACLGRRELLRELGLRRPADELQLDWSKNIEPASPPAAPTVVEMRNVYAGYNAHAVLKGLNLNIRQGEFAALVGDNGAGKTTLALLLAGLIKPKSGTIRMNGGKKLLPGRDVGLLFQNPLHQLFCETVEEDVALGPRNFDTLDPHEIDTLLDAADLSTVRRRSVFNLSVGQQQRTALAAVLAPKPHLVILDEPTVGQDWRHLSTSMDFLTEMNHTGCTVLLITHDFKLVHRYARRVLLLRDGCIVADGAPRQRQ